MKTKRIFLTLIVTLALCLLIPAVYRARRSEGRVSQQESPKEEPTAPTVRSPRVVEEVPRTNDTAAVQTTVPTNEIVTALILSNVPVSVRDVMDPEQQPLKRLREARALGQFLKEDELGALALYLRIPGKDDTSEFVRELKNDVMDALCAQKIPSQNTLKLMRELFDDPHQDIVLRDYALQHIPTLYEALSGASGASFPNLDSEREGLLSVLWKALDQADSSIAGTALLGLSRLSETHSDIDSGRVGEAALRLAQDPATGELARVTALQICARKDVKNALPLATQISVAPGDISLRIAAIGAVGQLGGPKQISLLETIGQERNERLQAAVTSAMRRIQSRPD